MHTDYAPDKITEDHIENVCEDLRCALVNVLENDGDEEECWKAESLLKHISSMLTEMMQESNDD